MADQALLQLTRRLEHLEDREGIRELRDTYHHLVNSRNFLDVSRLFVDDAVVDLDYFGSYRGRPAIHDGYVAMGERERFLVKQYISSHTINSVPGATRATGQAFLDARYAREGTSYFVSGRYSDDYVKTESGWKFSRMAFEIYFTVPLTMGWAGNELHHLRPEG